MFNLGQYADYREALRGELGRRKSTNKRYSMRAFARSLGVSAAFLSKILLKQSHASPEQALRLIKRLGLEEDDARWFFKSVQLETFSADVPKAQAASLLNYDDSVSLSLADLPLERFRMISNWYHVAILELAACKSMELTPVRIASELKIDQKEAEQGLERLLKLGFLKKTGEKLEPWAPAYSTLSDVPSEAVRNFHSQMINKALEALKSQSLSEREVSGVILSVDLKRLEEAKEDIRKFQKKFLKKFAVNVDADEVYQLNFQFFRLSEGRNQ